MAAERDLRGAVALVTGGTKGIGAELVAQLTARGARVISLSRSLPKSSEGVDGVDYRQCDIGDAKQIRSTLEALKEGGLAYIDILVLNAGIMPGIFMPVAAVADALEEECFRTNLVGAHFLTKYALPLLLASPYDAAPAAGDAAAAAAGGVDAAPTSGAAAPAAGSADVAAAPRSAAPPALPRTDIERTVVYVSSSAGFLEEPEEGNGMLAYRASKAGENGLMVGLHQLYVADSETAVRTRGGPDAPKLQRVVAVHPGFVQTGLGMETNPDFTDAKAFAATKAGWGAISLAEGTDTLLWTIAAANGVVQSGKLYHQRKVHSF